MVPRIDDLEHDTHEDGPSADKPLPAAPADEAAGEREPPPPADLAHVRDTMRHHAPGTLDELPWLHEDNPAIWTGDTRDLYDDE